MSNFWKVKTLKNSVKQIFDIDELFIQCNTDTVVSIRQVLSTYIYMGASVYRLLCVLWVFVWMCRCYIKSEYSTSKKPHVSGLNKLDALLHKTHRKVLLVLRYQSPTCVGRNPLRQVWTLWMQDVNWTYIRRFNW